MLPIKASLNLSRAFLIAATITIHVGCKKTSPTLPRQQVESQSPVDEQRQQATRRSNPSRKQEEDETAGRHGALKEQLPLGFQDVYLGMTVKELKNVHNVQEMPILSGQSTIVLHESKIENSFFENAIFGVSRVRDRLEWLALTIEAPSFELVDRLDGFIAGVVAKWGEDYEVVFNRIRHSKRDYVAPMLIWKLEGMTILATYTPRELFEGTAPATFQVRFIDSSIAIEHDLEITRRLDDVDSLEEFKAAIRSRFTNPGFKFK